MTRLALVVAALAALVVAPAAFGASPRVFINDTAQTVTPADVADALPAFQQAVDRDFAPYWAADPTLTATNPVPGDWTVTVTDQPAPCSLFGCVLGYHGVGHGGTPYAVVFAAEAAADGSNWQEVLTHELFEMLADPWAGRAVRAHRRFWIVEVCDPVVSWNYTIPSATGVPVTISDFVTPAWFLPGIRGPYDFLDRLRKPLQVAAGDGYISYWDDSTGAWATVYGSTPATPGPR